MDNTRKRVGRPRSISRKPSDAHLATTREVLDDIEKLTSGYSRMPLGMRLEHILLEYKQLKKLMGQEQINPPKQIQLLESEWTDEELNILKNEGWS